MQVSTAFTSFSFDTVMFDHVKTFADLFELKLQGLYDAEKQLVKALPKLAEAATDPQLRMSLEKHLRETKGQVARLEQVAASLHLDLDGPSCKAMEGLLEEADLLLSLNTSDEVMDAAIISAAQGVEHYEIAQYGTVVHFAKRLGYAPEALLLSSSLAEEKNADETLNQLAINSVDEKALG
ncbi:ferritin-like domain-containing protein [Hymenobacter bucti]|uniref:Ferritin-like domain-containing protein n=1 Tax=Hymenobacter bucti TaxID=1844114 RepID=A0ABW4QUV5_9BACT